MNHHINLNGYECHHIVPKSWKPEWKNEFYNLLKVPVKAHYVIHHLMWKAFPDDHFMKLSFWLTCHGQQKQRITIKVYKSVKNNLINNEYRQKMSDNRKR